MAEFDFFYWRKRIARVAGEEGLRLKLDLDVVCTVGDLLVVHRQVQELGKYAANAPHVHCLAVVFLEKDDLRRSVVPRADMGGEPALSFVIHQAILLLLSRDDLSTLPQ